MAVTKIQGDPFNPLSPGVNLLETKIASNDATIDFDTGIDFSAYKQYRLVIISAIPSNDNVELWMRFSNDGGSTYEITNYYSTDLYVRSGTANVTGEIESNSTHMMLSGEGATVSDGSTEGGVNVTVDIFDPSNAAIFTGYSARGQYQRATATESVLFVSAGNRNVAEATNGIRILFENGNIVSAILKLYGVN